jgi:cytochrome c oxidase accessory protein FixG
MSESVRAATSRDGERGAPAVGEPGVQGGAGAAVDWEDFRDHLSTADRAGRRQWLYPRRPVGRYYRWRTWLSWVLLGVMFGGPFVRIDGNPLFLMNIVERRFVILGQVFWPQDAAILTVGLLIFLTGIAVFTAAYGRLWCGWVCPQTVLMEMVFRKIEYMIDGDAADQRALARAPWTAGKVAKRLGKQVMFLGLSFVVGNTLLSYIIGTEALYAIITDNPLNHLEGLGFMALFTLVFYGIFARFREQACTFICPYGRLQSTLLDENSIVVAYDHRRGERRGSLHRTQEASERQAAGYGDCIDCRQCVVVCPTGIDIRNGTQMECVHCTACMDACDGVMDRIRRPRGLVRYASLNGIERGEGLRVTPRLAGYTLLLAGLIGLEAFLVFTRAEVEATLLRAPGSLYQQMPGGEISNLYLLKVINKSNRDVPVELRIEEGGGEVQVMGKERLIVPAQKLVETSVLMRLPVEALQGSTTKLRVGVYGPDGRRLQKLKTSFVGPRDDRRGGGR